MKKLVAYFSPTGTTKRKAEELAHAEQADLLEIVPDEPYNAADLDWTDKSSRSTREMNDLSFRPALKPVTDLSNYDEIFVGFPIWWGVAPTIVDTFLELPELKGKTVIPFATSGGSGIAKATKRLADIHPDLTVKEGRLLNGIIPEDQLKIWADRF